MITSIHAPALADAVSLSRTLADWCRHPATALPAGRDRDGLLVNLADCVEAIPPTAADLGTMAVLRNRLQAVRKYLQAEEFGAAKHEAEQLHRKLIRLPV